MFLHDYVQIRCPWQEFHGHGAVFFSEHPTRWHIFSSAPLMMMFTRITWLRPCLPGFSTVKLFFPFVINMNFVKSFLRLVMFPSPHQTFNWFIKKKSVQTYDFYSFITIIYFDLLNFPHLAGVNPYKQVSVSFWHNPIILRAAPYFLAH